MILSPAQDNALQAIARWTRDPYSPMFVLGGYAGTGKSTILDRLLEDYKGVRFVAPTGKAVSVLRSKLPRGTTVTTVHSYLYSPREVTETDLDRSRADLAALKEAAAPREAIKQAERLVHYHRDMLERGGVEFVDRSGVEFSDFIVVDEASMITDKMRNDLLDAGSKVLFVGDPGQLPPVKGREFFADNAPDVMLTEVHRQAADSRILRLATAVRNGEVFRDWGHGCEKVEGFPGMLCALDEHDQVITGTNKTRMSFNVAARKTRGYSGTYPNNGEPIICLRNDHVMGFINGVAGYALSNTEVDTFGDVRLDVAYDGHVVRGVHVDPFHFVQYQQRITRREMPAVGASEFDFGFAITVHKSQGSEWDSVMVIDDKMAMQDRDFRKRWIYTAATRAKKRLTWVNREVR